MYFKFSHGHKSKSIRLYHPRWFFTSFYTAGNILSSVDTRGARCQGRARTQNPGRRAAPLPNNQVTSGVRGADVN